MADVDPFVALRDWRSSLNRGDPAVVDRFLDAIDATLSRGWVRDREYVRTRLRPDHIRGTMFDLAGNAAVRVWLQRVTATRVRGGPVEVLRRPSSGDARRIGRLVAEFADGCVLPAASAAGARWTQPAFGPRSAVIPAAEMLFTRFADIAQDPYLGYPEANPKEATMTLPLRMFLVFALACFPLRLIAADIAPLDSPNTRLQLRFRLTEQGRPGFDLSYRGKPVASGTLGLEFAGSGPFRDNLKIVSERLGSHDETYPIPVGKTSSARDRHNELIVSLEGTEGRKLGIAFRAFDDGIAFRYLIPGQADFVLTDELTELAFSGDPKAHALPLDSYTTPYEKYYETLPVSAIGPKRLIGMPLLLEFPEGLWLAVTEANLTDFAGMYLAGAEPGKLHAKLSPLPGRNDRAKVIGRAPHASPWRLMMVADDPGRLLESNLIFHLSDPPAIKDTSWIKPGKTTFPWWNGYVLDGVDFRPGVNTATMRYYIDFCSEQGIPYHSLDGIDIAWYGGPIQPNGRTDITKAAPSLDMPELLRYAKEKGVQLRLWVHWKALKPQIDEAFAVYEKWGIEGVMVDFMDRDDQEMVRFYHEMAEKAAEHHLTLTLHGAYKPTGMERTWPNVLNYEAALNQEYNKWQPKGVHGTPPVHNLDIAFIRMIAGPLDYHHGGMRNELPEDYRFRDKAPPVQGTRGHQLAMYVVYQDHLPMMADSPTAYRNQPGLGFMTQVPTNWDETRVLHAEFGRCLVVARRKGNDWYLGGMTAIEGRKLALPMAFLDGRYEAELTLDNPSEGATSIKRHKQLVSRDETLRIEVPRDGGFVARLTPQAR